MVVNNQEVVALERLSGQEFCIVLSVTHIGFDVFPRN
jgi:hypothetical protein